MLINIVSIKNGIFGLYSPIGHGMPSIKYLHWYLPCGPRSNGTNSYSKIPQTVYECLIILRRRVEVALAGKEASPSLQRYKSGQMSAGLITSKWPIAVDSVTTRQRVIS